VITALGKTGFRCLGRSRSARIEAVIGTAFLRLDCVHGRIITYPAIPDVTPRERGLIYDSLNEVAGAPDTTGLAGAGSRLRASATTSPPDHRWTQQYRASETEKIESMGAPDPVAARAHSPADETALVHGDFRSGTSSSTDRAARRRRARLGALDARPTTRGSRLTSACPIVSRASGKGWRQGTSPRWVSRASRTTSRRTAGGRARRDRRLGVLSGLRDVPAGRDRPGIMGRVRRRTANDRNAQERGFARDRSPTPPEPR